MKQIQLQERDQIVSLESKKEILLSIMDSIHSFCVSKGIKYSLMYGSLLGAVRHGGFIPWDDDIDIVMNRNDYERFIAEYPLSQNNYPLINYKTNKAFHLPFSKVFDKQTVLIENVWNPVPIGACVDVFPMDFCGNTAKECAAIDRKCRLYRIINSVQSTKLSGKRFFLKNLIILASRLISRRFLNKRIDHLAKTIRDDSDYSAVLVLMTYKDKEFLKTEKLIDFIPMDFEGHKYLGFKNYDYVLSALYSDYMKLPPVAERKTHHDCILFWRNKDERQSNF